MTHAANYSQSRRTARRPLHIQKVEGPVRRSNMGSTVNVSLCGVLVFCNMILVLPSRIKINTVGINLSINSIKFVKYSVMIEWIIKLTLSIPYESQPCMRVCSLQPMLLGHNRWYVPSMVHCNLHGAGSSGSGIALSAATWQWADGFGLIVNSIIKSYSQHQK